MENPNQITENSTEVEDKTQDIPMDEDSIQTMSDEEFEKNFDKIVHSATGTNLEPPLESAPQEQSEEAQNQIEEDSKKDEKQPDVPHGGSEVNEEFIPPFDKEIFEKIPEEYKSIFKPIKANGTMIQPSPDEMIRLIQLGSKYYADREKIKPQLKIVKMIEKAGLSDEEKLLTVLEAAQGNKEAISKLIKENNIDLDEVDEMVSNENFQFDPSAAKDKYNQNIERELKLEEVNAQLEASPLYDNIIEVLSGIDEESKEAFIQEPEKILALEQHMQIGLFDKTMQEIQKGKIFGQYLNMPFIKAYEQAALKIYNEMQNQQPQSPNAVQQQNAGTNVVQQQQQVILHGQENFNPSPAVMPRNEGGAPSSNVIDLTKMDIDSIPDDEFDRLFKKQFGF